MNIYEIQYGDYCAKINLSRGANCISLKNSRYKANILREPDYAKPLDNPYLYGMPVLFPVNRISGGKFRFEGREYLFEVNEPHTDCHLHGTLHESAFQMISCGEHYVIGAYRPESREYYFGGQHDFEVRIGYYLTDEGMEQKTTIKNLSTQNMPLMVGFHTTFLLPFMEKQNADDLRVFADVQELIERNKNTYLPTGKILEPDEITRELQQGGFVPFSQSISRHYKTGSCGQMSIRDIRNGVKLQYENSTDMKYRLLYNGNADAYICLEPQNCMVNYMNMDIDKEYAGFAYLMPGASKTYASKISLKDC